MATLVLGAVGALIGGPIGAALGAAIGNRVDQQLLAPKGRRGPRLGNLAVQSSTYGNAIPKLFGAMRVAGTVIWSTDLIETRSRQGNGKGRPKTTVYSYAVSFAVALSARPIVRVGRIWADGKLLRGEAGDFKFETGFRLHHGSGDGAVDPLIAAAEGAGAAPAYRGLAYAVFEDFQLGDFGNRIPSLSFEVFADEGRVTVGTIAAALAPSIGGDGVAELTGFAAEGDSVRGALQVIADVVPISLRDDGHRLMLTDLARMPVAIPAAALVGAADAQRGDPVALSQRSASQQPEALALAYYDAGRDYLPASQTARRDGGARRTDRIDLPATLDAGLARQMCEARLTRDWAERLTAQIVVLPRWLAIAPGDIVALPGHAGRWVVRSAGFAGGRSELALVRHAPATAAAVGDPGRHVSQPDLAHGPTSLVVLDLPALADVAATTPQIAVAAAGVSPGWRRAALSVSRDGGASWQDAGATAAPATVGSAVTRLAAGPSAIIDRVNAVEIALLNAAMDLNDADIAALLRGNNLAMIGDEAIQFGRATPIAPGRWRLTELLRGRRGTEFAIATHQTGERFVLIDVDSLSVIPAPDSGSFAVMASGIGDPVPQVGEIAIVGNAVRPLAPCHVSSERLANGDSRLRWVRRSREGWAWPDGVDAPLGEEGERYAVAVVPNAGVARSYETAAPVWTYPEADRAADLAAGATGIVVAVRQIGRFAQSHPSTFTLPL